MGEAVSLRATGVLENFHGIIVASRPVWWGNHIGARPGMGKEGEVPSLRARKWKAHPEEKGESQGEPGDSEGGRGWTTIHPSPCGPLRGSADSTFANTDTQPSQPEGEASPCKPLISEPHLSQYLYFCGRLPLTTVMDPQEGLGEGS